MSADISIKDLVSNYISEKKQFPSDNLALLTVARVGTYAVRGSLDFGGSEYNEAGIKWLTPRKGAEDDTYGWWHLSEGMYVVELNERISAPANIRLLLQIWEKAQRAGIVHPSFSIEAGEKAQHTGSMEEASPEDAEPLRVTVSVGSTGIDIKENARFSKLILL